ncbi:hypothetical protein ALQ04_04077 [Pseudomonas cichorii]|uniref:Lipoprotein n=1 Tax=Pseudomonas cichorii TaxID=36746 RepID=A0A3M4M1X1_PSECI|nr:hypothetical protein [Pseudomonas cichorii]RMQ47717.1 hypothetical protein ALQ04_04077 [Pseudomonas cichorii]
MRFLAVVLAALALQGCSNTPLGNLLNNERFQTTRDVQASWVGSSADELVMSWGTPKSSYAMAGGANMLSYEYLWLEGAGDYNPQYVWCVQRFLVENGIITRWGLSGGCPKRPKNAKSIPDTPVPQPTL